MSETASRKTTLLLTACALLCLALLGLGEVLQHVFGMKPCSWCVLQRLIFLLVGVACALGAWVGSRPARLGAVALADLLATSGLAAALYQHFVASRSDSCLMTLADQIVMALSLHEIAPWMFMPYAPCNEANMPFLGVPFALWAALAFTLLGLATAAAFVATLRRRPAV